MNSKVHALSAKLQSLSTEQMNEVDAFVESLMVRTGDRELSHAAAAVSAPAFEAIWNSAEDDVYDAL